MTNKSGGIFPDEMLRPRTRQGGRLRELPESSKGVGLEEAKKELTDLRELLSFIRDLQLESFREKEAVRLKLRLGLISGNTIVEPSD